MIPLTFKLRVKRKNGKNFKLWLPLFLLWLIILPLFVILTPLTLLTALLLWPTGKGKFIFYSFLMFFGLIGHISGLKIDIQTKDSTVYVNL